MNNNSASQILSECSADLTKVATIVTGLGTRADVVPYLNQYAIIRACGAIELAVKTVISDFTCKRSKQQVKNFINKRVRDSSSNPSWTKICELIGEFDDQWVDSFKNAIGARPDAAELRDALKSLVDSRNEFAHGGSPGASIGNVVDYFQKAQIIVEELDRIVN